MKRLVVYGAGGHAKVVVDAARRSGWHVDDVLDDDPRGRSVLDVAVRPAASDDLERLSGAGIPVLVAIGDNRTRERIAKALEARAFRFATVVHPSAVVAESVRLGEGSFLAAGAIVNPDSDVGAHSILNTGSTVDHDCTIGSFVHLGPGVHLCGGVTVGAGTLVGVGASAIPYVSIGEWAVVGAGAAVIRPVPAGGHVVGVPAKDGKS